MVASAFSHVGHCVSDLERSRRFYCDVFGFAVKAEVHQSDESIAPLVGLTPPLSMTSCFLVRDGLVLELVHYAAEEQARPFRPLTMNEPGLTQISLAVDDLELVCAKVRAYGGEVIDETRVGAYMFVRDPDGQLLELLPTTYRANLPPKP